MNLRNPLHELDNLHASAETKEKTLQYVLAKQSKKTTMPIWQKATLGTVLCALLLLFWQPWKSTGNVTPSPVPSAIASTITLDINPSIELSLDKQNKVIQTKAYNADAKRILNKVPMQDKEIDEALQLLFKDAAYQKYLSKGILEVGIYADDTALQKQLEVEIDAYLNENTAVKQHHCASINKETHEAASEHHTSQGKYRVIELIRTYDSSLTVDELTSYSMRKLYTILETYDAAAVPQGCHSQQSGTDTNHHDRLRKHGHHD